jgi:ubiquitin-activating enzyme E1
LPVCIFWGGIIAQEVMKYTSKYTPLKQWLHHNFISCLPSETNLPRTIDPSSPYNDYVVLFGDEFLEKCGSSNLFMVGGNGAGIEMMRILGSMGMSRK